MTLFNHQSEALSIARERNIALFHDCGTGKTCTSLNIIKHWHSKGEGPAIVVCPLSIIEAAWLEDAEKFAPELSIASLWLPQTSKRKEKQLDILHNGNHDIYVANFETFKSLLPDLHKKQFGVIIVDESSKMKCPKSAITRALLSVAGVTMRAKGGVKYPVKHVIPHRYVLSGTPAPNDESEYWSQVTFVTGPGGYVFNDNFYAFRSRYFTGIPIGLTGQNQHVFTPDVQERTAMVNALLQQNMNIGDRQFIETIQRFESLKQFSPQQLQIFWRIWQRYCGQRQLVLNKLHHEFMDRLSMVSHVVRKADAVDLPEQIHEKRIVILSKPEQDAYDQLQRDLVLQFADEQILATSALVETMKLRQLTSGFCYGDEGTHQIGKSKLNELKDLLAEIGDKQVIIWANFQEEIKTLVEMLPNSVALWGQGDDRQTAVKAFQNGDVQYLIANPASAAHGLTFVNCNYAVYFSLNYSYELQKQSQDRIHRIGQRNMCTYYYLIAKGTIDEVIYNTVGKKSDLSKEVLNYLRMSSHGKAA